MMISIIIPIYNVEKYLSQCLDSILNQTYKDIEIICVNDGSTDSSFEILEEYSKNDNRIVVINKSNGGLSSARNAGIDIAKGEYLCFVDSDDYISSTFVEDMINSIGDADLCICGINQVSNNCCLIKTVCPHTIRDFNEYKFWDLYFDSYYLWCQVAWNKLYKRNLFENIRYPIGKYCEDTYVIHQIVSRCEKIYSINKCLYSYRKNDFSIMRSGDPKVFYHAGLGYIERLQYFKTKLELHHKYGTDLILDIVHQYKLCISCDTKLSKLELNDFIKKIKKEIKISLDCSLKRKIYLYCFKLLPNLFAR